LTDRSLDRPREDTSRFLRIYRVRPRHRESLLSLPSTNDCLHAPPLPDVTGNAPLEAISATKVRAKIQEFKVAVLDRPSSTSESCHSLCLSFVSNWPNLMNDLTHQPQRNNLFPYFTCKYLLLLFTAYIRATVYLLLLLFKI